MILDEWRALLTAFETAGSEDEQAMLESGICALRDEYALALASMSVDAHELGATPTVPESMLPQRLPTEPEADEDPST